MWPTINRYVKSWKKVDDFTFEVETSATSYDLPLVLGVTTWASSFKIVPKHIFEKQADISAFRNTYPVCLGPYLSRNSTRTVTGQSGRSATTGKSLGVGMWNRRPKYALYKDFGTEDKRVLSFIQNQYDIDTFMGPDSIKAAQAKSANIETFNPLMPYHNMDDACQYGISMNDIKSPYDKLEVRLVLALALDLKSVGINALSGEFKALRPCPW